MLAIIIVAGFVFLAAPLYDYSNIQLEERPAEADSLEYNMIRLTVGYVVNYDPDNYQNNYIDATMLIEEFSSYDWTPPSKPSYINYVFDWWSPDSAEIADDTVFYVKMYVEFVAAGDDRTQYIRFDDIWGQFCIEYDHAGAFSESYTVERYPYSGTYSVHALLLVGWGTKAWDVETEVYVNPAEA